MTDSNRHIIQKQIFDLTFPKGKDAFALQQSVSKISREDLTPAMEEVFDTYVSGDTLIQIDKLGIDLGTISLAELEQVLVSKIIGAIKNQLPTEIESVKDKTYQKTTDYGYFEGWLHYLEKGYLSWRLSGIREQELTEKVIKIISESDSAVTRLQMVLRQVPNAMERLALQHSPEFLESLIEAISGKRQLKSMEVKELLSETIKELSKFSDVQKQFPLLRKIRPSQIDFIFWKNVLSSFIVDKGEEKERNIILFEIILQDIIGKENVILLFKEMWPEIERSKREVFRKIKPFVEEILENIGGVERITKGRGVNTEKSTETQIEKEETKRKIPEVEKSDSENSEAKESEVKKTKEGRSSDVPQEEKPTKNRNDEIERSKTLGEKDPELESAIKEDVNEEKIEQEVIAPLKGITDDNAIDEPENFISENENELLREDIREGFYIQNAGIILLHPFLSTLFKTLGFTEEGKFTNIQAQQRAVHLLQFLATGETNLPEYDLLFPKFLCGVPLKASIERAVELSKEEKEEAEGLLRAAINHWGALGNASIDGLREGFLLRSGKLEQRDGKWYLQVEQKTIDILLDKLPWNLSMVQLSWMKELLRVEWV